jgi:hypothetical protein
VSHRESVKATVKVTLTGPDGKVLKVIEGENPDPFDDIFTSLLLSSLYGPTNSYPIWDIFGNELDVFASPRGTSADFGALAMGPCLVNCAGLPNSPPNGPGFLFFSEYPNLEPCKNGMGYFSIEDGPFNRPLTIISGIAYSPLIISPASYSDISYTIVGQIPLTVSQSATNVGSSPVYVATVTLIAAISGTAHPSPAFIPVSFFILTPPLVWSPGVTITISVTYTFPYGVALVPSPSGIIFTW